MRVLKGRFFLNQRGGCREALEAFKQALVLDPNFLSCARRPGGGDALAAVSTEDAPEGR